MSSASALGVQSLLQVAQRATDLDASVTFYQQRLGGRFLGKFVPPGLALVELGGVRLLLEAGATSATLYFRVDDLDAACQRLREQQVPLEAEPHLIHRDDAGQFGPAGEEEWMAFLRDPDGNLVALVQRRSRS